MCVYTLGTAANSNSKIHIRLFCDCLIVVAVERAGVVLYIHLEYIFFLFSLFCPLKMFLSILWAYATDSRATYSRLYSNGVKWDLNYMTKGQHAVLEISLLCSGVDCQEVWLSVRQNVTHVRRRWRLIMATARLIRGVTVVVSWCISSSTGSDNRPHLNDKRGQRVSLLDGRIEGGERERKKALKRKMETITCWLSL